MCLIHIDKNSITVKEDFKASDLENIPAEGFVWIDIRKIEDTILNTLGSVFQINPLAIEDLKPPIHRPKIDEYKEHVFLVLNRVTLNEPLSEIIEEQISFVLGSNYLFSFHDSDIFNGLRQNLEHHDVKFMGRGADYLLSKMLDKIIDDCFLSVQKLEDQVDRLEEQVVSQSQSVELHAIYLLKKKILAHSRPMYPTREIILKLETNSFFGEETKWFIRDLQDHVSHLIDLTEVYKNTLSGIIDLFISTSNSRLSSVMKVLTIIATIFIPITFITGIYGMNFINMPELSWKYGYFSSLALMTVIAILMIFFFRKKKWI